MVFECVVVMIAGVVDADAVTIDADAEVVDMVAEVVSPAVFSRCLYSSKNRKNQSFFRGFL